MEQVVLRPWGNSQGVRISKKIMDALNWQTMDTLQVEVKENQIILKKVFKHKTFEERIAEYDGQISISEFDWGEPQGRELL